MVKNTDIDLPPPTSIALVLCDNVYKDSAGKQALVGLFHKIIARSFPAVHGKMCAYVSITSVRPNTNCSFDIVYSVTDVEIVNIRGPAPEGMGPTDVWDVVFELPPLVFPEPGKYYARFLGNNTVLASRPFDVVEMSQESGEQ